jgi:hypothetical protein
METRKLETAYETKRALIVSMLTVLQENEGQPVDVHERLAQSTFSIINWVITGQDTCADKSLFEHLLNSTEHAFAIPFASSLNYLPWHVYLI